jgi:hypothetical protein
MKHLGNTIVVINILYDLPPDTDSEPSKEGVSFSEWTKPFCGRRIISVNDIKHNSKRAWVKPGAIASETETNDFGAS